MGKLVLSREKAEVVVIPTPLGPIRVTVEQIKIVHGSKPRVKISFEAPPEIRVMRSEVMEAAGLSEVCPEVWSPAA